MTAQWQALIAPAFALLGVVVTLITTTWIQERKSKAELFQSKALRAESIEREDRLRFMTVRFDLYEAFVNSVDKWMIEAQVLQYMRDELTDDDSDIEEQEQDVTSAGAEIRDSLNRLTLVSPFAVLEAAGEVNSAARDNAEDPLAVQSLLLRFLFECRKDLTGDAKWPHDFEKLATKATVKREEIDTPHNLQTRSPSAARQRPSGSPDQDSGSTVTRT